MPTEPPRQPSHKKEEFLELLPKLIAEFPCPDLAAWGRALPIPLAPKGPDGYVLKEEDPLVSRLELRADFASGGAGQKLSVDFRETLKIAPAELDAALKAKGEAHGGSATYALKGKTLRVVFASAAHDVMTGFELEASGAAAKKR
jgi:hypothetical protein